MRKLVALLCLVLSACYPSMVNESLSTPQERAIALRTIAALRSGDQATLRQVMVPALYAQTTPQFSRARALMNIPGTPELVTANVNSVSTPEGTQRTTCLQYQYGEDRRWIAAQICLDTAATPAQVNGWTAIPYEVKPTAAGDLTFTNKGPSHYLWLLAMLGCVATAITAFVFALRSKGIRRRWLWAIGSLLGFGQFFLNWTTGVMTVQPFYISILGAAMIRPSPFDAWLLSFSPPVVAIIFLILRKTLIAKGIERAAQADVETTFA